MYLILLLLLFEPFLKCIVKSINIRIPFRLFVFSLFMSIQIHGNFQIMAFIGWIAIFILIYDYFLYYYYTPDNQIDESV